VNERDLTPGEIGIKLDGLTDQLKDIRSNMFTTDLFGSWREGNEARVRRIEDDQKEWTRVSTQAHAELGGQINTSTATGKSERERMAAELRAEISAVAAALELSKETQTDIKEKQDARRYDLVKAVALSLLVAVLGVIGNLTITLIKG
jgi:hypothetical protein